MSRWKTLALSAAIMAVVSVPVRHVSAAGVRQLGQALAPSQLATIVGTAWNADNTGIAAARLRLRNITTGKVVAATRADDSGRFRFEAVGEGTYVIELVDETAKVLAVGHPFTIASGETVATFVRVGTRVPWFTGFFSNAAAAAIATAASEGITALAPVARPASRKQ